MSGLFGKIKTVAAGAGSPPVAPEKKKAEVIEPTPLEKMLVNAGPVRQDGSDKFFGMENFGNTCYCNSIVQALYYSVPFRENVMNYPPHSPNDTPNGNGPMMPTPTRMNGAPVPPAKPKGISASEALKRRAAINSGAPPTGQPGTRPEDKPDSPEYKKKHAMLAGPILELTYENANYSHYGMEETTFTALKDMFMALVTTQSRMGVLSPQRFLEIFKRDNEMFRTSMHQDAHEFYGLILNAVITNVEEKAKLMKELEPPRNDAAIADGMMAAMKNAASAMGLANGARSPGAGWVHEIFEGVLTSETKCLTCETASQRDETFLDLSIDLEQHSSVTSCLRKFSAEEMLCERNKFHCDNCGGLQEAEKRMKIKRLPKILTLHLKRFKYTEDMTRLQKLFHRVVYPYHLRMFNTTDDAEDPDRMYELYAVVVHIGGNAYHGHYVSIIKTQDRGWLLFDDEMVEPVDKHYVRNFFGDKPGMACAYVLFYQETTLEAVQKEQEEEGLAEVALASQEAGIALGHPAPNGTHPSAISKQVSVPLTPLREPEFASLDHAFTAPFPGKSPTGPFKSSIYAEQMIPQPVSQLDNKKVEGKSKEEREREKKQSKEDEKAKKAAEKEKAKADEKRRKEAEIQRKESQKSQADQVKAALAASKISAAEDEEKRRKEAATAAAATAATPAAAAGASTTATTDKKENGIISGLSLSRNRTASKSLHRKSLFSIKAGEPSKPGSSDTAVEGESGPPTPEKHDRSTKERFSFSLGRKKSNIMSS